MSDKRMNGIDAHNNKYDKMSRDRISKENPEYLLKGYYNYILADKSYTSAYVYLSYVCRFCKTVGDIKKIDIDDYNEYLATYKGKSSNTQIDAYHALQKYSTYLKAKGITEDYMQYVHRPKYVETQDTREKREAGYLKKSEITKLIQISRQTGSKECWKIRNHVIMIILFNTGIRVSALYKLDVDNVDLERKTITVLEKGSKYRKISISDAACEYIQEWLDVRSEILDGIQEPALIISQQKRRMDTASIRHTCIMIGDAAVKGKHVSPHRLRATYATLLYDKTKDLYMVQECMGHSNPKTTEIYIRGQKGDVTRRAADIIGGFLGN